MTRGDGQNRYSLPIRLHTKDTLKKIAFVVAFATIIAAIYFFARNNTKRFEVVVVNQTQQHLLTIAKAQAQSIKDTIDDIRAELQMLAENPVVQQAIVDNKSTENSSDKGRCCSEKVVFDRLSRRSVQVSGLYRLDAYGIIQHRMPFREDSVGADFSNKPGVKYVIKNHRPYISSVFKSYAGRKSVSVCQPVFSSQQFIGIVRVVIFLDTIQNLLSHIKVGQKGYAWIIDDDGIVVVHPKPEYVGKDAMAVRKKAFPDYGWSELENIVYKMAGGQEGVGNYQSVWRQDEELRPVGKLAAFAPIKIGNRLWSVALVMDYDEIADPINAHARNIFAAVQLLILLFIGAGAGFYIVYKKKVLLEVQAKSAERLESLNRQLQSEIAEHKRAETEREALITELEVKNAELERFTYTVSHDLKSPLITIGGFLGLLEQDVAGGDVERVKGDIKRIEGAAGKMQCRLDELLELSRIGRLVNPPEEVLLRELAREAVDLVAGRITERGVQIEILPDLPLIFGDHPRLLEVLQNLIDNAVKFMGEQPKPHIEIGARQNGDETVCYVRDNGIGIEPCYHDKIFGLFNRLNQDSEGTGVGLALVKRIVEVHGGRIWVESEGQGKGSTFCFTICTKGGSEKNEKEKREREAFDYSVG